jgi:hypothetical protein
MQALIFGFQHKYCFQIQILFIVRFLDWIDKQMSLSLFHCHIQKQNDHLILSFSYSDL